MPKMKTNRATRKRFKRTATGKWKFKKGHNSHLGRKKRPKRIRRLRKTGIVGRVDAHRIQRLLPGN